MLASKANTERPGQHMPLTDKQIQAARPDGDRVFKLSDGGSLQLWVTPAGGKLWNLAYRFAGKQHRFAAHGFQKGRNDVARLSRDGVVDAQ